jgi:hypothetical protein
MPMGGPAPMGGYAPMGGPAAARGGAHKGMMIGGIAAAAVGGLFFLFSIVCFYFSVSNHGAADRLEGSSEVRGAGSLGRAIVRRIREKANNQMTMGIVFVVLGLGGIGGGVTLVVLSKKRAGAGAPAMMPGAPMPMGGPPMPGPMGAPMAGGPMGGAAPGPYPQGPYPPGGGYGPGPYQGGPGG